MSNLIYKGNSLKGFLNKAKEIFFDNTASGMAADNVQGAIDELKENLDGLSTLLGSKITFQKAYEKNSEESNEIKFNPRVVGFNSGLYFAVVTNPANYPYNFAVFGHQLNGVTAPIINCNVDGSNTLTIGGNSWYSNAVVYLITFD